MTSAENVRFLTGVQRVMPPTWNTAKSGLQLKSAEVLAAVSRLNPQRVLYISCHPGSFARDLGLLVHEHGMSLVAAGVLDMFPHTTHVESLALLEPRQPRHKRRME